MDGQTLIRIAPKSRMPVHMDSSRRLVLQTLVDHGGFSTFESLSNALPGMTSLPKVISALSCMGWIETYVQPDAMEKAHE